MQNGNEKKVVTVCISDKTDFKRKVIRKDREEHCQVARSVVSDSFATPWTVAHQAPPSMGFSRQEYWSGLPFPSAGDFPNPEIKSRSPALQADALTSEPPGKPYEIIKGSI